jgi:hypothetical protein
VHGSVTVPPAAAGAHLEVRLQAPTAGLARAGHVLTVGRLVRSSVPAGTVSFRVPLDARAKRALRVRRHLALGVTVVLTPPHRAPTTLHRAVTLRA